LKKNYILYVIHTSMKKITEEIFPIQRDIDDHIDQFEEVGIE